jgi:nuclear pore complex protein Nup93
MCCMRQLRSGAGVYGGNDGTHRLLIERLKQQIMDLTLYTSQLRYRFPAELHEALALAQAG